MKQQQMMTEDPGFADGTGTSDRSSNPITTSRNPILNTVTLQFRNAALERAYISSWCEKQLLLDRVGCYVSLIQLFAGIAFIFINLMPMSASSLALMAGSGLLHGLHAVLMTRHAAYYRHNRNALVLLLLVCLRGLTAATVASVPCDSSPTTRLFYTTGIIPLCWYDISLPLPFRHQVLAQLTAIAIYQVKLAVPACHVVVQEPRLMVVLQGVWRTVQSGLALTLQIQGITVSQRNPTAAAAAANGPLLLCWSSVTFLLLLLGLIIPAHIRYCLELTSRARFYKQWQQQQQQPSLLLQPPRPTQQQQQQQRAAAAAASRRGGVLCNREQGSAVDAGFSSDEGVQGLTHGDVFDLPFVSLLMTFAALCASSCLLLMSYGPHLLQLQL